MPACRMSVGFVVNPCTRGSAASSIIWATLAPSVKSLILRPSVTLFIPQCFRYGAVLSRSAPGLSRELPAEARGVEPRRQQDSEAAHGHHGRPRAAGRARGVPHQRLAAQEHDELVEIEERKAGTA